MQELDKYAQYVNKVFSNDNNWSILISDESNDIRNKVMKTVKLEQIKRRKLREFLRVEKEKIIAAREQVDTSVFDQNKDISSLIAGSKKDFIQKQNDNYNKEYQQYFEQKVTKAASGNTLNQGNAESGINFNSNKYPKSLNDEKDTVEEIAQNVQQLVKFCMRKNDQFGTVQRIEQGIPTFLQSTKKNYE